MSDYSDPPAMRKRFVVHQGTSKAYRDNWQKIFGKRRAREAQQDVQRFCKPQVAGSSPVAGSEDG